MTEQEILKKIDAWDEQDKIHSIVDFVESLPVENKTSAVLGELARAYNNLFWLDQTEDNKKYLQKAIEIFQYLESEQGHTASWNYRIGYSYFYLGEIDKAEKYFEKELALGGTGNETVTYLKAIKISREKGIPATDVIKGGVGKIEFPLLMLIDTFKEKAKPLASILGEPAKEEDFVAFENKTGIKLPENFKQLHRTFSGQKEKIPFFDTSNQRFVGLNEIETIQQDWLNFVKKHHGENWEEVQLSEENCDEDIQNKLFNPKWLPILSGENFLICLDLDPVNEEYYGQIIGVSLSENIEEFYLTWLFPELSNWVDYIERNLENGELFYNEERNILQFTELDNEQSLPAYYNEEEVNALEKYIDETFGKSDDVFHELVSEDIHCDVYIIKPTPERNYYTLVTGGAGAYNMNTPNEFYPKNIELAINLPPDWDIKSQEEKNYWPIRWLKTLARLPINHETYIGGGHTIPSGEDLEGTRFSGFILTGALSKEVDEEGDALPAMVELPSGKKVSFLYLVPIYQEEMSFKLDHSSDELFDKFIENNIPYPPVVDIHRKNVCEAYQVKENPNLLDDIAWAFTPQVYDSLMNFWEAVKGYNEDICNNLDDFTPFATIFSSKKVKLIYDAYIKNEDALWKYEKLLNPQTFEQESEDGFYHAEIIAECVAYDSSFGALELLQWIHNSLTNKELGDHIFFEGFSIEGYEEDGTPVIYLTNGS